MASTATNLATADIDNVADVFVRDIALGTTVVVSVGDGPTGGKGDAESGAPAISQTGRFVAFTSLSGLDAADADALADVLVRDVLGTVRPLDALPPRERVRVPGTRRFVVVPASCPVDGRVAVLTNGDDVRAGGPASDILLGRDGADV